MKLPEDEKKLEVDAFDEVIFNLENLKNIFLQEEFTLNEYKDWLMLAQKNLSGVRTLISTSCLNLLRICLEYRAAEEESKEKDKNDSEA